MKKDFYPKGYKIWCAFLAIMMLKNMASVFLDYSNLYVIRSEVIKFDLHVVDKGDGRFYLKNDNKIYYNNFDAKSIVSKINSDDSKLYSSKIKSYTPLVFSHESKRKLTTYYPIYSSKNVLKLWLYNYHESPYFFLLATIAFIGVLFKSTGLMLVNDWKFKILILLLTAFGGWCINGWTWGFY